MEKTTAYSEVKIDHIDDNGVAHIDSYKTDDENESGNVLGYIVNGETYWKDHSALGDPLVQEVIADYNAQVEAEKAQQERIAKNIAQRDAAKNMANELSRFVNNYGCNKEGFVEQVMRDHPTLQQSTIGLFLMVIEAMAEKEYVDARNESAHRVCKMLVAANKEHWVKELMEKHGETEEKARVSAEDKVWRMSNLPFI